MSKRPSYPNANTGTSRPIFNSSEFDNLTGPVHAPPQSSAYGNIYVNSNVPPAVGQYTPPMAAPTGYSTTVGLPPRAPSFYNPAGKNLFTFTSTTKLNNQIFV
jgi:hypothetical protein